jgi:DNA-binding transcriptional MocR family regulator
MKIDLTTALPPSPPELDEELCASLAGLAARADFGPAIRKNRVGGNERDREAAHAWLAPRLGPEFDVGRLIVTNGTQSALMLLLQSAVGRGGALAAESLTYVVLKTIAARVGISVTGVPLDDEGIIPAALDEVCRRAHPRALYLNPTVHNPTTAVMSTRRRREVISVARQHEVILIEDDVLGAVHPEAPPPLAVLAPDITWYVMSLSKCFAMGLRMAYFVAPTVAAAQELIEPVRRLSWWFPNSLSAEIASGWALSEAGRRIAAAVRAETEARQAIAAETLDMRMARTVPGALHLWLHLPASVSPAEFAAAAEQDGVLVRPADLFSVDGSPAPGCARISLTGPETRQDLRDGLSVVASVLARYQGAQRRVSRA